MDRAALPNRCMQRALGFVLGLASWVFMTSPLWASLLFPVYWAWAFLAYAVYWLCKSLNFAVHGVVALRRMRAWEQCDWLSLGRRDPRWGRLWHLVVFPTYREPVGVLEESLRYLRAQDFPHERISVLLAFEARDPEARAKAQYLRERFGGTFAHLWATFHPDRPGEVRGKSSNLAYAVPWAKRMLVEEFGVALADVIVTICDADSRLHPKYLSALAHQFLTVPNGERCLYQGAVLFHANLGRVAGMFRALNGLYSAKLLARLPRRHALVTQSTYSLSLAACEAVHYWDVDVIPEDSHMFFKVLFHCGPGVTVHPIYLPVWADAAEGRDWRTTLLALYRQTRRWAWGIADVPYILWHVARRRDLLASRDAVPAAHYVQEHVLWAAHWFVLVGGLKLLPWVAPLYARTPQAEQLGSLSSLVLLASLPCLLLVWWIDLQVRRHHRPPSSTPDTRANLLPWLLLPLSTFVGTVLPAVDAHTRLLLGSSLEYQVTEKRAAPAHAARASAVERAGGRVVPR